MVAVWSGIAATPLVDAVVVLFLVVARAFAAVDAATSVLARPMRKLVITKPLRLLSRIRATKLINWPISPVARSPNVRIV